MKIHIRTIKRQDIDQVLAMLKELFSIEQDFFFDKSRCRNALEMFVDETCDKAFFVAIFNNQIAGICSVQTVISTAQGGKAGIIEDLIVSKDLRRKGIASTLIQKIEDWAVEHNISRLQLLADLTNDIGLDFYEYNKWSKTQLICLRKYVK